MPFFGFFFLFRASSGLFRASSGPLLASSGPLLASSWLLLASSCPVLAFFWLFPRLSKISKIQALPETSFSVHKTLRFEHFFAKFWIPGLLVPLLAFSWPLLAFSWPLLAFSWPLLGLFWPLPGLFLFWPFPGFCKISKIQGPQRRHFLFIKYGVSSSFSPNSGFLAFWCLFSVFSFSSGPLLASSGPLPGLFWPLPGLFWPLPGFFWPLPVLFWPFFGFFLDSPKSPKFKGFQRRHFLFIKHCVSSIFSPNSGFLAFWGFFVRNPAYPVVFGRCAPAASLRLRLGPVEDNDRRRRCPSPRWDAWKTLELNPKMLELRVVLGWAVCYAQVRAAWVCTHTSEHP